MTQQNPRELLKQGDPQAIASSINRTLKPKGINAEVTRDNGCLHIFLESGKVPDQMVLVDFIRTGMTKLGLESIHTVKVYGIETGQDSPAWQDQIELIPTSPMLYEDETSMSNDSVGLDDVESEAGDYYQDEDFDGDNENDDDEEDDDEETPPPKKQFPKWVIPVGILVPVLALAGLFFTKSPPFSSDSTSEPSPPVVIKPSSKATSGASKPVSPSPSAPNEGKPSPSPSTASAATPSATASAAPNAATKPASPVPAATSPAPKPASPAASAATPKLDNWRVAVNQAQKAAILAQTAQSQTEWNAVAADWQKAVQLMNSVPKTSPNHQKAQQKAAEYKLNLEVANRRAAAAP
ncbi:MAG: hypothetical protein EAZ09_06910 [Oscillatoriales cyanobacterium]|nr:MAG: hypothetical protein EAZ18_05640 [Oscillatoriales cyanobacterium]TAH23567.1 MAG: hypothetical protein EAZ09_06910 [Oscillatoriales cyanobacterium]